jgi:hypothetical protein
VATVKYSLAEETIQVEQKTDNARKEVQGATKSWIDFRREVLEVSKDRRQHPRIEFHCLVRIEGVKSIKRVTNISMGGLFVECKYPSAFKEGQTVHMTIKLPSEDEHIKAKAEVANVRDTGIGLKFVDLTQENQEIIRFYFDAFKETIPLK